MDRRAVDRSQACREGKVYGSFPLVLGGGGEGSSNSPLLKTQTGSAHFNAYRLSSVKVEHSKCPHLK